MRRTRRPARRRASADALAPTRGALPDTADGGGHVAILVPTFRRPDSLETLLRLLAESVADAAAPASDVPAGEGGASGRVRGSRTFSLLVADNDAERQEGREVVERLAPLLGVDVSVVVEAARGVSSVRNRLVTAALDAGARHLLMIDDDEWPSRGWVGAMLRCAEAHAADIVSGPVRPDFEAPPPAWVVEHALFDDAPHPTGAFPRVQRTGNTLFRAAVLADPVLFPDREWFSVRLGRFGGEDSHLVERLVGLGARHVWCEEAVVHERVPEARTRFDYLAARAWRNGNTGMLYRSMLLPGPLWGGVRVGRSAYLALRWVALAHRCLRGSARRRHLLDGYVVRGRLAAHAGRHRAFY